MSDVKKVDKLTLFKMSKGYAQDFNLKKISQLTDPNKKIMAYQSFLSVKKDVLGMDKLSEAEKLIYYVELFDESIQTDGFVYYFSGIDNNTVEKTLKYLKILKAFKFADLLNKVFEVHKRYHPKYKNIPDKSKEEEEASDNYYVQLDNQDYDKEYHLIYSQEPLGEIILDFIDRHKNEIIPIPIINLYSYEFQLIYKRYKLAVNIIGIILVIILLRLIKSL